MTPEAIIPLIEDNPQVSAVSILPGETSSMIFGHNTENTVVGEGTVTFDILSSARIPCHETGYKNSGIIFDVEAQNRLSPVCRITPRGIYYDARLISFQKDRIFSDSHYDTTLSFKTKKEILTAEFRIVMNSELERQVVNMCNWSAAIRLEAMEEGLAQGLQQGHEKGLEQGLKEGLEQGLVLICHLHIS